MKKSRILETIMADYTDAEIFFLCEAARIPSFVTAESFERFSVSTDATAEAFVRFLSKMCAYGKADYFYSEDFDLMFHDLMNDDRLTAKALAKRVCEECLAHKDDLVREGIGAVYYFTAADMAKEIIAKYAIEVFSK